MARHKFGGGASDWAFTWNGDGSIAQAPNAVLTFWDSLVGGNQYLAAPMPGGVDDGTGLIDGTGLPVSSVTCDSSGEIPDAFSGPDGVYKMAADASGGSGPRRWIYANDMGADIATLLQAIAAVPALQAAPVFVYYDEATSSYPARPNVSGPVWWFGPVSPFIGGGSASGSDVWLDPAAATPSTNGVASVGAADQSISMSGTGSAPLVSTGTLDQIATARPAAADWSNNGHRITGGAPGVAGTDFATVAQLSSGGGLLVPTAVKTASYTAAAADLVRVSTAGGSVTVTLPAAPPDSTRIGVKQVIAGTGNTLTVAAGGTDKFNVTGGAATLSLTRVFQTVTMQYHASDGLWIVTGADQALVVNTTASVVTFNGDQAAGANGGLSDAAHVHPAGWWVPSDNGLLAASAPPTGISSSQTIAAGNLYLLKVKVRYSFTASQVQVVVSTAGAGASSGSFAGLYSSAGTLMAGSGSADIGSQLTSLGLATLSLGSAQALTAGTFVWVALLVNLATTQPALRTSHNNVTGLANANLTAATAHCAINGTGLSALPASVTPANNNITSTNLGPVWVGLK